MSWAVHQLSLWQANVTYQQAKRTTAEDRHFSIAYVKKKGREKESTDHNYSDCIFYPLNFFLHNCLEEDRKLKVNRKY